MMMMMEEGSLLKITLRFLLCLLTIHHPPNFCTAHSDSEVRSIESERHALLNFRQDLLDPSNRLAYWASDVDCCHWVGVAILILWIFFFFFYLRIRNFYFSSMSCNYTDHGQERQRVQSERTICNQRKLEKEGLDEVRFMVEGLWIMSSQASEVGHPKI